MSIQKRLAKLEQSRKHTTSAPKHIIATVLQVPDDAALYGTNVTEDNQVTFYADTLKKAHAMREQYLSEHSDFIALVSPFENGSHVLAVLAEKHKPHWLDDTDPKKDNTK